MTPVRLSVLDQSPVRRGSNAATALRETVALAEHCDALGYERFWVAEHHNLPGFAGTSPEVLIGEIASRTRGIRVGSGGVMLPHYSALHVAEGFRVLEALHPGRIDLGLGRAPGSDPLTAAALAHPGGQRDVATYPEQVDTLLAYLGAGLPASHPFARVKAAPTDGSAPQVWLLGSGIDSALLAAERGLPFAFAHFFASSLEYAPAIVDAYRKHYRPSDHWPAPRLLLAVSVICAPTEEEAVDLSGSLGLARLLLARGRPEAIASVDEARSYPYTPEERAFVDSFRSACVLTTPDAVAAALGRMVDEFGADEIAAVTVCHDFDARKRSYSYLAEACGLSRRRNPTET